MRKRSLDKVIRGKNWNFLTNLNQAISQLQRDPNLKTANLPSFECLKIHKRTHNEQKPFKCDHCHRLPFDCFTQPRYFRAFAFFAVFRRFLVFNQSIDDQY